VREGEGREGRNEGGKKNLQYILNERGGFVIVTSSEKLPYEKTRLIGGDNNIL